MDPTRTSTQQLRAAKAAILKICAGLKKSWKVLTGAAIGLAVIFLTVLGQHSYRCVMGDYGLIGRPRNLTGLEIIESKIEGHVVDEPSTYSRIVGCDW
ncbi:MAG: hypothetical protein EPN97_00845 [Alphaproteobacteria bacterium]|nr:MAG: hypothetical protein EPN97_00845 [Alphaproteobacteria bacterium]